MQTSILQLGNMGNKMLEREVAILKKVHHPHIVFLEEVFETSEVCLRSMRYRGL